MKRISLFLSCLFIAVSMFASNLSGLLNKVGVEYDYDYVFVTNIADNTVKLEGTLNEEALAVKGLVVKVMVNGQVVGDATIAHDTISYAFAGTYAQGDTIQANLLFKYDAGQTVTSGINYVVAYETIFNVTVPEGSEGCYLVFTEEGLAKAVEMKTITPTAFTATVPFNALNKEYYYSLKAEENFYEVDSVSGEAVTRTYAKVGQNDTVQAWYQLCAPYYELVIDGKTAIEMEEGNVVYDLKLEVGSTLQIREHLKDCKDSITTFTPTGTTYYKLIDGNLALMQLGGYYDVVFNPRNRQLELIHHIGNILYIYKNFASGSGSDIDAEPYAGFNATAERVDVDVQTDDYYLKITTGRLGKAAVAGLVGNAYDVSFMKQVVENPSALVFDYKTTIAGAKSISIVKTSGDPASVQPVFVYSLDNAKVDEWKKVVIYLDENMNDKNALIQENEGDSYYILFNIEGKAGLTDGELDIRDMYIAPYIKYSVTVPEGTEECYINSDLGFDPMVKDASNHYTIEYYDFERHALTYTYHSGNGAEFVETDAKGKDVQPRFYRAEDVVVAWKNTYCYPKYGFLLNEQLTQFAEIDGGNWIIEKQAIAEEDSAYYIINICTEDTMKAAEVPAIAGDYKIELVLADTSVIFTKIEPVDPTTLCYDPADINSVWPDCNVTNVGGVLTFSAAWEGIANWLGEADWSKYDKLTLTYTSDIQFKFMIEDGTPAHNLETIVDASDVEKELVIDDFGSLEMNHITQYWFQGFAAGTVTVKSLCLSISDSPCKTIWEGEVAITWGPPSVGMSDLSWGGYDWSKVEPGNVLTANFTQSPSPGYMQIRFATGDGWNGLPSSKAAPGADGDGNIPVAAGTESISITLTQEDLDLLNSKQGLTLCGEGMTIKSVELCASVEPEEECLNIVDEAFNALDDKASIKEGTMTFKAINSSMLMSLNGLDVTKYNTLTIEYEATTDFQVQVQDAQGEEQFVASADTNIAVYHYLANVDMKRLVQFIFVADTIGTVKINSICFSAVEYPTYYLGNKWDGAEEVTFLKMLTDNHGDWFITGVLGSDSILLAFAEEPEETVASYAIKDIAEINKKTLLIGDEVEFHCFEFLNNAFTAEVLVRPTYVKHPWNGGEWTWAMMTLNEELEQWEYTGIWGGQGFNINADGPYDNGALWFAANDTNVVYTSTDGEIVKEPAVGTEVTIYYVDDDTKAGVRYEVATGLIPVKKGVKVVKFLHNGQLIIRQGEKNFNVLGQEL